MRTITALESQKHNSDRVNIFLDGKFAFGIGALLVIARGLKPGQVLTEEEIDALLNDETVEKWYAAALNFLSYRQRSQREIEDYLRRKQVEADTIAAICDKLTRAGLLNDQEFARFWIDNRQSFRPRGTRALRVELLHKGLAREIIDEALSTITEEEDAAFAAGLPRVRTYQRLEDREFERKMVAFLMRRGFPHEAATLATKRLWEERAQT